MTHGVAPTTAALVCLLSWVIGAFFGAYRYERLWHDRSLREIFADLRARRER